MYVMIREDVYNYYRNYVLNITRGTVQKPRMQSTVIVVLARYWSLKIGTHNVHSIIRVARFSAIAKPNTPSRSKSAHAPATYIQNLLMLVLIGAFHAS